MDATADHYVTDPRQVKKTLEANYGLHVLDLKELSSLPGGCYLATAHQCKCARAGSSCESACATGEPCTSCSQQQQQSVVKQYICKLIRKQGELYSEVFPACGSQVQADIMRHIQKEGIMCPEPVRTLNGQDHVDYTDPGREMQVLHFLPGKVLNSTGPMSANTIYDMGAVLGLFHKAVQAFTHDQLPPLGASQILANENIPRLTQLAEIHFQNKEKEDLIQGICQEFVKEFEDNSEGNIETGVCHNDIWASNIILLELEEPDEAAAGLMDKYAVIDFALVTYSFFILDVAYSLSAFMMNSEDTNFLLSGKQFLSGYNSILKIKPSEGRLLYMAVKYFYCKVLVILTTFGEETQGDADVAKLYEKGWQQIRQLSSMPLEEVEKMWKLDETS